MKLINKFPKNNKIRIVCAMSGGVDSSVAAALLKKQGYDAIGIFLKFWSPYAKATGDKKTCRENACCNQEALFSARQVASKLKIPFYVLDVSKEFKKEVVDYYVKEYENGRTPNPCVVCNKKIKFGWLLKKAKELDAKYLASGHYARLRREFSIFNFQFLNKSQITNAKLLKAKDRGKDQTYFLWQLTNNVLKNVMFPLGNYTKGDVRKLAHKFDLPTAEKKESQDICFIEKGKNNEFLARYARKLHKRGKIVDCEKNILGEHLGLVNYTIGQRHGLEGIQLKKRSTRVKKQMSGFQPAYVIKFNIDNNQLVVGCKKELFATKLIAGNLNWVNQNIRNRLKRGEKIKCTAKIRYNDKGTTVLINLISNKLKVYFCTPVRAITSGQSIVFYKGDEIIGGGIIK